MPNRAKTAGTQKRQNISKYKLRAHSELAKSSPQGAPEGVFWGPSGRLSRAPIGPQKGPKWDPQNALNSSLGFQKAPELEPQPLLEPFSFLGGLGAPPLPPPFWSTLGPHIGAQMGPLLTPNI